MKHEENVPLCRNFKNGECKFGKEKCWFNHKNEDIFKKNEHEDNNVIQRILNMMEKMSERIVHMEISNQKNVKEGKETDDKVMTNSNMKDN